jgi:hypothetical protein
MTRIIAAAALIVGLGAGLALAPQPASATWGIYYGYILNRHQAPLDIIKAEVYEESSDAGTPNFYTRMGITTKNVSGKPIVAIRVKWTLFDAFGEELESYSGQSTDFSGPYAFFAKGTMGPGSQAVHVWNVINTHETAQGYVVQVTDVLFADGEHWQVAPTYYSEAQWTCRNVPDNAHDCREQGDVAPPDEVKATETPAPTAPSGNGFGSPVGDPKSK